MRRLLPVVAASVASLALGVGNAGATNECRGLMVCVPVAGPWVVLPFGRGASRPRAEFQLACPRRYVVGGLDAELSHRAIEVTFVGALGSPVNPGITTSSAAVFVGTYTGTGARTTSFRPHIGCLPASGGGGTPPVWRLAAANAVPPGRPVVRRVRTLRLEPASSRRAAHGCRRGERLVGGSHALGFYTRTPPPSRLARAVVTRGSVRRGRIAISVTSGRQLLGVRAVVQVHALCARAAR